MTVLATTRPIVTPPPWFPRLCARYGIKITSDSSSRHIGFGPISHGCDPRRRTVYFDHHTDIHDMSRYEEDHSEILFHEVVHVIMQPP